MHYSLVFDSEELPCLSYVYYRNTLPHDSLCSSAPASFHFNIISVPVLEFHNYILAPMTLPNCLKERELNAS